MFELSQRFYFEAAHTLVREHDAPASARVHGHTYLGEVTLSGTPDKDSGMVADLALVRRELALLRDELDHHLLDELPGLGAPTLENLAAFVARRLASRLPGLSRVRIWREASGDSCVLDVRAFLSSGS